MLDEQIEKRFKHDSVLIRVFKSYVLSYIFFFFLMHRIKNKSVCIKNCNQQFPYEFLR